MWFAAFASAARATISPTFPWRSIFAFGSFAHLDLIKLLITFAMEINKVRLIYFFFNSLNLKTAQSKLLQLGFTKVMASVARIFRPLCRSTREVLPPHLLLLAVKPYTLTSYTFHHYL
jgi:hypothetical protein